MSERQVHAHERIEHHLRTLVRTARPGDKLPTDRELAERFAVSRMTARQAVASIVAQGRAYRVVGSGTYVAATRIHRRLTRLLSFKEHMRRQGREPSAQVLWHELHVASPEVNVDLHQPAGSQAIFLRRVLCGDGVPIAVQDAILPERCRAAIDGTVLKGGSLHEALRRTGSVPYHARGTLVAESADPELAHLLDVAVGSALLVQRQLVNDEEQNPMQLVITRFVGERFVFDVDQYRDLDRTPDEIRSGPPYQIKSLVHLPSARADADPRPTAGRKKPLPRSRIKGTPPQERRNPRPGKRSQERVNGVHLVS